MIKRSNIKNEKTSPNFGPFKHNPTIKKHKYKYDNRSREGASLTPAIGLNKKKANFIGSGKDWAL